MQLQDDFYHLRYKGMVKYINVPLTILVRLTLLKKSVKIFTLKSNFRNSIFVFLLGFKSNT